VVVVNDRQNVNRGPVAPRAGLRWLERGLFTLGLLLMGLWFRNETEVRASHSAEAKKLEAAELPGASAGAPVEAFLKEPWCPEALPSGVFGRIEIPRLGISALIAEGAGPAQLERAVGHVSRTAFPGRAGNCALAGHRDSFLRGLGGVRENDLIRIDTLQGSYTYVVEWGKVVGPRRADVIGTTDAPSLTLVPCYPFHAVGPAADRFVVRARLVEPTAWIAR
jgi:sortase A